MRMKTSLVTTVTLALVLIVAQRGRALDLCNSPVIAEWQSAREHAASRLVKIWMNRGRPDEIAGATFELVRREVLLANCVPPLSMGQFYTPGIDGTSMDRVPVAVLFQFLRKQGISLEGSQFLEGRAFDLVVAGKEVGTRR